MAERFLLTRKKKNVTSSNSWDFRAGVNEITLNSVTLLAIMGIFWANWKILHISCLSYSSIISIQSCKHDRYLVFNCLYLHTSVPAVQNSSVISGCQEKHQQILQAKNREMLPKYQGYFNTSLKTSFKYVIAVLIHHQLLGRKCSLGRKNLGSAIHETSHSIKESN